jgi:hypothetical protein
MKIKQDPITKLWCRDDGAVLMPPGGHFRKFRWTFGSKGRLGYLRVKFRGKNYQVHRLIAGAFLDNPEGYSTVDHYPDRNPSNNRADNLRYASPKMQADNTRKVDDSIAKFGGVRRCDDPAAYARALYESNPEYAERQRARRRAYHQERYARDPEYAERRRAKCREYHAKQRASNPEYVERERARGREKYAKQKALGKHTRTCPDGKRRLLTDAEYDALYKKD